MTESPMKVLTSKGDTTMAGVGKTEGDVEEEVLAPHNRVAVREIRESESGSVQL